MSRYVLKSWSVLSVLLLACMAPAVWAGEIFIGVTQYNGGYAAEITGQLDGGINSVRMQTAGGSEWDYFDIWDNEFEMSDDTFTSLAEVNAAIVGSYTLEFVVGGVTSTYSLVISDIQQQWIPAVPVLNDVPAMIMQQHTFSWNWNGVADVKVLDYGTNDMDFELFQPSTDPGFGALSLLADFGDKTGSAEFLVTYANLQPGLASLTLTSGPDLFGDNVTVYTAGADDVEFTVVPEPASMGLLVVGMAALLRRRRQR